MLKLEQVPDTVAWKLHNKLWGSSQFSVEEGRAAIAAALNAWPGVMDAAEDFPSAAASSPSWRSLMIKPDMIPNEVVEAAAKELAYTNGWRNQQGVEVCRPVVKDIIAAALNAWPGMHTHEWQRPWLGGMSGTDLILPLPQETRDDE